MDWQEIHFLSLRTDIFKESNRKVTALTKNTIMDTNVSIIELKNKTLQIEWYSDKDTLCEGSIIPFSAATLSSI